jgi:hypothetical protein
MRRFALYILIALAAFGLGLSTAMISKPSTSFPNYESQIPSTLVKWGQPLPESPTREEAPEAPVARKKFVCGDKALSFMIDHLRKTDEDPGDDGETYIDGMIRYLQAGDCSEIFQTPRYVDLDSDGKREVIVGAKFACGASGNCSMWVLQPYRDSFRVLFKLGSTQRLKPTAGTSRGYRNITARYSGGMMAGLVSVYKSDGSKYRMIECHDDNIAIDVKRLTALKSLEECE